MNRLGIYEHILSVRTVSVSCICRLVLCSEFVFICWIHFFQPHSSLLRFPSIVHGFLSTFIAAKLQTLNDNENYLCKCRKVRGEYFSRFSISISVLSFGYDGR